MEVIQWTSLWNTFNDEFENEKNLLGGSLGDKAKEDLRQRIIEHVMFPWIFDYVYFVFPVVDLDWLLIICNMLHAFRISLLFQSTIQGLL